MKIRRSLILGAVFLAASTALAPSLGAQESSRIIGTSSGDSTVPAEYQFLTKLVTTFGTNLSTRDAATELNDSPNLVTNQYSVYTKNTSTDTSLISSRLVRNNESLGFLSWLIKDSFNKDKVTVFEKKEWVDAGVPEYVFLEGFTSLLSRAVLQDKDGETSRINVTATTEENTEREFQF